MARQLQTGKRMHQAGFTLMELLVVLFLIGLIAALAVPTIGTSLTRAREAALQENLTTMRRALDDYYSDKGRYPPTLSALTTEGYLRAIPDDPIQDDRLGWALDQTPDGGISDIHSHATETGLNDRPYNEW